MRRENSEINNFLQLPDTLLIYLVTILCFDVTDEAHIDESRFSLQCINKKFYSICNCKALWQNKPIILSSGKFNDGTFKLLKRKTQGTEGICYHAYCRPHRKEYAIKRVNRILSEDEGVPYYMLRVLSALRNLRHPGVNELLYVSLAGPKIYTIYSYVELTLQDVLSSGQKLSSPEGAVHGSVVTSTAPSLSPLEQHVAIDMMSQLMSAISYLHDRGILHRNLKPKHILIAPPLKSSSASSYLEGAVLKISDFSLARTTFHPPRDLTAEVITLWYRPPEILLGLGKYTSAVDVWSAGCVFAEMLEGRPLFAGLSEIDQLFQIFSKLGSPDAASTFRELPFYQDGIFPDWDKNLLRNSMRSLCRTESDPSHSQTRKCPQRDDECVDLLNSCFLFEPSNRILASNACQHPCLLSPGKSVAPTVSGQGVGSEGPCLPLCMRTIPSTITAQHTFLRSLETARDVSGAAGTGAGAGAGSKILDGTDSEQAWEDMGLGNDFAITDWMIKISDQFSGFTCLRTVFLAGALMERFKRDCSCQTPLGNDLVAFSSSSSSNDGQIGSRSRSRETNACQDNQLDACRSASAVHLKLLGATCLHIASKLEDVAYVGVRDFLLLMANSDDSERITYRVADILQLEETLLTRSNFEMYLPTVIDFLHIYFDCIPALVGQELIQNLSKYLGEVSLLFPSMFAQRHTPSVIATSVLSYAMSYFGLRDADRALKEISEYRTVDIISCVHSVVSAHGCIERKHIYSAVTQKYSDLRFSTVSQLPSMSFSDRANFIDRLHDLDRH